MTPEEFLTELQSLAKQLQITVRFEKGDFTGGYCIIKQQRTILANKKLPLQKKLNVLAQGLSEIGLEEIYLKPLLREFIDDEVAKAKKNFQ
ncbi:MAG: hypothetical protein FJ218_00380 [Ignavibacteria bacterium]|nr:hypothetical protein [Ignavibacteria bacterium]